MRISLKTFAGRLTSSGAWISVVGTFLCSGLIALGLSLGNAMLLSLIGTLSGFIVLRRYFLAHPSAPLLPAEA